MNANLSNVLNRNVGQRLMGEKSSRKILHWKLVHKKKNIQNELHTEEGYHLMRVTE